MRHLFPKSHWNRPETHHASVPRMSVHTSNEVGQSYGPGMEASNCLMIITMLLGMMANKDTIPRVYSLHASVEVPLSLSVTGDIRSRTSPNSRPDSEFGANSRVNGGGRVGSSPPDVRYCSVNPLRLQELHWLFLTPVPQAVLWPTKLLAI